MLPNLLDTRAAPAVIMRDALKEMRAWKRKMFAAKAKKRHVWNSLSSRHVNGMKTPVPKLWSF